MASDADRLREIQAERAEIQAVIDGLYRDWERLSDELSAVADGLT